MTKDRKAALRTVFFFSSGTAMPTQMPRDRRQNFNSPMVFQSDSQMYWLAQRISFFIGIPPSIERFLHGFLYLQFSTWDGRMEGALDRFGETCYHKMQDSLYETESAQNMKVLKAYRKGPGGTGCLYIEGLRRQDGREICRLLIWEFIPVQ